MDVTEEASWCWGRMMVAQRSHPSLPPKKAHGLSQHLMGSSSLQLGH